MKKHLIQTTLLVLNMGMINLSQAQDVQFEWVKRYAVDHLAYASSIGLDKIGNVYTCGLHSLGINFNPGQNPLILNTETARSDIFISKHDTNGLIIWARKIASEHWEDRALGLDVDDDGSVYTTGYFSGEADFDPGPGNYILIAEEGEETSNPCAYVNKLNTWGVFQWAKSFNSVPFPAFYGYAKGACIKIDPIGNVVSAGVFRMTRDFDPGNPIHTLSSSGKQDVYISKLNPSGGFVWARRVGGTGYNNVSSLTVDATGNIYFAGHFKETIDLDPGPSTLKFTSNGNTDVYIVKLNPSGNILWARSLGGPGYDYASSIALDPEGHVYCTGGYMATVDFDPGPGVFKLASAGNYDIFFLKLDSEGNFQWAKRIGGPYQDDAYAISVDASGYVYSCGGFSGNVDFDPGPGSYMLNSFSSHTEFQNIYINKLDPAGNFVWALQMGNSLSSYANAMTLDNQGNIHTTGIFSGTVDFDPGPGIHALTTSTGSYDIFIHKLSQNQNGSSDASSGNTSEAHYNEYTEPATIDFSHGQHIKSFIIRDMKGNLILEKQHNFSDIIQLDIPGPVGIYIVELHTDCNQIIRHKVIKTR